MSKNIILHQYPRAGKIPNFSPFCIKVETYLRMMALDYKMVFSSPRKAPLGKLPFIEYADEIIADSSSILTRLENKSETPLDEHLNEEQRAELLCVQRMLEEHFYWIGAYSRFCSTVGWPVWSAALKKRMPPLVGTFILARMKANFVKQLNNQGIGRHDEATIFKMGIADLEALNVKLQNRKWYFNNKPSTLDIIIYSFLGATLANFWACPLKNYILAQPNLLQYFQQIQKVCFPELGDVQFNRK